MKTAARRGWGPAAIILAALGLSACSGLLSQSGNAGSGSVVVRLPGSLGQAAKTVLPDFAAEVDSISVTLSASGQGDQTQSAEAGGSATFVGLVATTWTVEVSALKGGVEIGSGSASVDVTSGSIVETTIRLYFAGSGDTGDLAIPLTWPSSTGIDYLAWEIVGGEAGDTLSGLSGSATLSAQDLEPGSYSLSLSFKRGGADGTPAGTFVESVNIVAGLTSGSWLDAEGEVQGAWAFEEADFFDANANLGGLVVRDESASGAVIALGFSSGDVSYDLYSLPASRSVVLRPAASVEGQYLSYSWNGGGAVALASGESSAVLAFDAGDFTNVLEVLVLAPDGASSKTYAVTWHGSAAEIGVTTSASYQSLALSATAAQVNQGTSITVTPASATLQAVSSGWAWYLNGTAQASTGPSLTIATSSLLGGYVVSATVSYGGVGYSGSLALTVDP